MSDYDITLVNRKFIAQGVGGATKAWSGLTVSNGNVYAADSNTTASADIYMQTNGVGSFVALSQGSKVWSGMTSLNGNVYCAVGSDDIYMQTAGSGDFNPLSQGSLFWRVMTTANGNVYCAVYNGDIYMQTNGTGYFLPLSQTPRTWSGMTSFNGDVYICNSTGTRDIYVQTAGTGPFNPLSQTQRSWSAMTSDSHNVYAAISSGELYVRWGGVGDFVPLNVSHENPIRSMATDSKDGIYAGISGFDIYYMPPVDLTLNDMVNKKISRSFTENLSINEGSAPVTAKVLTESLKVSDTLTKSANRALTDSIRLADSKGYGWTLNESLKVSDGSPPKEAIQKVLTENLQVNDSFGKSNQIFVYIYDDASSSWIEVEGVDYFKVEKRLNQMSKFEMSLPQIETDQKLYVKEFAKVLLISDQRLILKGRIQKVTYETSYSCKIEGFGMEAVILDKEYRNANAAPAGNPDDEDRVQYDNISAQSIAKYLLSTNGTGAAPWTMTPRTSGIFATDYGDISMRFEYANKLTALGNLTSAIKYDWWVENEPITYTNDYFHLEEIKGNQVDPNNILSQASNTPQIISSVGSWTAVTESNGNIYACQRGGDIYMQTGGVGPFVALGQISKNWSAMTSLNGNVYAADIGTGSGGDIYIQTAGVGDFLPQGFGLNDWAGLTTANGNVYAACSNDIYMQTGGTGIFNPLSQGSKLWKGMTSLNGNVYAVVLGGDIYIQTNGTGPFVAVGLTSDWYGMANLNGDVYAATFSGLIYKQTNGTGSFVYTDNDAIFGITSLGAYGNYLYIATWPNYATTPGNGYIENILAEDYNRIFTITGAKANAEGTDYQRDVTNLANYVKMIGYGDGINQLFTSTYNASPIWTTLAADITATDTTISLVDASAFPSPAGTIRIAEETIAYTGVSGDNLTGCVRVPANALNHRAEVYVEKYVASTSPEANSSIYENGLMELTLTNRDIRDLSTLELVASKELIDRMTPIERITLTPCEPQTVAETLDTGDLVSIIDAESSLNSNYRIVAIIYENNYGSLSVSMEASNKSLTFIEQMQKEREKNQALQKYMQGATNIYAVNNYENCDPTGNEYLNTLFYIPPEAIAINHVKVSFKLKPFRAYNSADSGPESAHTHTIPFYELCTEPSCAITAIGHGMGCGSPSSVCLYSSYGSCIAVTSTTCGSAHCHAISYGIHEDPNFGSAPAATVQVYAGADGSETIVAGGPYSDTVNLDVTNKIVAGWNNIQFRPNKIMRIEANVYIQIFIESV